MKKIQYKGKEQSLGKWCKELGLNYYKTYQRLNTLGYSVEKAFEKGTDVGKKKKVLITNDWHVPYENEKIYEIIEQYKDIDYLIIAGDFCDNESCSSFPVENRPSLSEELVLAHKAMSRIREITSAKIIAIAGNHCLRLEKDIIKLQEKHLQNMLDPQMLRQVQEGFQFHSKGKKIIYEGIKDFEYTHKWWKKLFGNLLVCHPLSFSNVPGRIAEQTAQYFLNKGRIDKDDIVVLGHTHKSLTMVATRHQNVMVVENGCCCNAHEYSDKGKLTYSDQVNCCTYLEFNEGEKINRNDVKMIYF